MKTAIALNAELRRLEFLIRALRVEFDEFVLAAPGSTLDTIGSYWADTATIDFTYNNLLPQLSVDVRTDSIDNTLLANMAQATVKGRASAAGTGDPTDLTATQLLTIIETVDGAGSGLDADLLDGMSSAAFATASHAHAGEDITSGTVADARIASTITRDSEVFSIVLAADGSGSGLDADTLRGTTPTAFGLSLIDDAAASNARTTLGLVINTDVQAYDAELAALAGLTSAADKLPYFTGSGTAAVADFTAAGRALVDDTDATAQRATLGLVIGTNVQAQDATLQSIAALGTAADKVAYTTGVDTWAETALTSFGRSLIDDAASSDARTTLGLVIGTNVQAYDAELAALAGLTSAADKLPYFTGSGTAAVTDLTTFGRSLIDDAAASDARTTLGLVIGTNVQAQDATLQSIAALGTAADKVAYTTGVDTWAETALTSFGRSLIDDAAASDGRTTLGLGTIATEAETNYLLAAGTRILSGDWDIGNGRKISADKIQARSASGLALYEDGGLGLFVEDSTGSVGIGTTSPTFDLNVVSDTTQAAILVEGHGGVSTPGEGALILYGSRGTAASPTATQDTDVIGAIYFQGYDTARSTGAAIKGIASDEWGTAGDTTDDPTDLVFYTVPNGSSTLTERMRITKGGALCLNTTSSAFDVNISSDTTQTAALIEGHGGTGVPGEGAVLLYGSRGTAASPTATQATDVIGAIYFQGYDTARSTGAKIYAIASAEWGTSSDATDDPTDLRFATVPDGSSTLADQMVITSAGLVGVGTASPAISDGAGVDVNGKILRLRTSKTPATAGATGNAGEICWDSGFLYICTASNTWKRVAIATW